MSSDIIPVTTKQDFFGIATAEAVYAGVHPLLPRRLAYPEIYRINDNPDLFYSDTDELTQKLAALIRNPDNRRNMSHLVANFAWQRMIRSYDDVFEGLLENCVTTK